MYKAFLLLVLLAFSSLQLHAVELQRPLPRCQGRNFVNPPNSLKGDWPFYGLDFKNWRNPPKSVISKKNVKNLTTKWTFDTIGAVLGNPAIVDGVAYFGDTAGFVYAVDAVTGSLIWQRLLGDPEPLSNPVSHRVAPGLDFPAVFLTPTVSATKVYVCTFNAYVAVLDRNNGTLLQYELLQDDPDFPQAGYSSVCLLDHKDEIIVPLGTFTPGQSGLPSAATGRIFALKASDINVELWKLRTSNDPSNPLTDGGKGVGVWGPLGYDKDLDLLYVGIGNNKTPPITPIADSLIALKAATGTIEWHVQFTNDDIGGVPNPCSPVGRTGKDWDVGMAPILLASKNSDGSLVDIAVVGQKSGALHAVNRKTGEELWNTVLTNPNPDGSGPQGVNTSGCSDGKVVYVTSHYSTDGFPLEDNFLTATKHMATGIFAVRVKDGALLWRVDVPGLSVGPLTVANNVLYHASFDGILRAFDVVEGTILFEFSNSDTTTKHLSGGTTVHNGMVYLPTGTFGIPGQVIALGLTK
jgi:polyvinyl alcohol dehydrogenase (cytochrome)